MSLSCGECDKIIFGNFGILYQLKEKTGKTLNKVGANQFCPNSAVCGDCFEKFEVDRAIPEDRALKHDVVYAYALDSGSGKSTIFGSVNFTDVHVDEKNPIYIDDYTARKLFPGAITIIESWK